MDVRRSGPVRTLVPLTALGVLVAVIAWPALAADPSSSPSSGSSAQPSAETQAEPTDAPKASKAPKADRAPSAPEIDARVTGTVASTTDAKGRASYTLTVGGTTYELDAGPPWFYGVDHPLKPFVGKAVTIAGGQRQGSTEIEVATVNGTAIREPGKPPSAGGWKRVGKVHPGWSQEKWDRWGTKVQAKRGKAAAGAGCWPPGHCKGQLDAQASERPGGD